MTDTEKTVEEREATFRETAPAAIAKIRELIKVADDALEKAARIAEEAGVPFYSCPSMVGMTYTPDSFDQMYEGIDPEIVEEVTGVYPRAYSGWEHSDIC